ncbi:MAG: hypothetical protein NVSMB47_12680 [Polyangiales bacterium]
MNAHRSLRAATRSFLVGFVLASAAACGSGAGTPEDLSPDADSSAPPCDGCTVDAPPETPTTPVCGDRILESGETCDDGNTKSGDGCSATSTACAPSTSATSPRW